MKSVVICRCRDAGLPGKGLIRRLRGRRIGAMRTKSETGWPQRWQTITRTPAGMLAGCAVIAATMCRFGLFCGCGPQYRTLIRHAAPSGAILAAAVGMHLPSAFAPPDIGAGPPAPCYVSHPARNHDHNTLGHGHIGGRYEPADGNGRKEIAEDAGSLRSQSHTVYIGIILLQTSQLPCLTVSWRVSSLESLARFLPRGNAL
jgi:hypothetical protein